AERHWTLRIIDDGSTTSRVTMGGRRFSFFHLILLLRPRCSFFERSCVMCRRNRFLRRFLRAPGGRPNEMKLFKWPAETCRRAEDWRSLAIGAGFLCLVGLFMATSTAMLTIPGKGDQWLSDLPVDPIANWADKAPGQSQDGSQHPLLKHPLFIG